MAMLFAGGSTFVVKRRRRLAAAQEQAKRVSPFSHHHHPYNGRGDLESGGQAGGSETSSRAPLQPQVGCLPPTCRYFFEDVEVFRPVVSSMPVYFLRVSA